MSIERVMVVAHGHFDVSRGGAEMVAGHLARGLRNRGIETLLVARTTTPSPGASAFSTREEGREILFHTGMSDHFLLRSRTAEHVWRDFAGLLERFGPQVIHFQHYMHMGIELIRQARLSCPDARIVLTLHEYLPICANQGQMVRTGTVDLCERSSPADCARCFPDRSPGDFFLRKRYLQSVLSDVDLFVSPSRFLRQRYVDWGLAPDSILVLENAQPRTPRMPPRSIGPGESRNRFGYFGQLNPYKGVDLLLEAAALMRADIGDSFHVDVNGANLRAQEPEFRAKVRQLADAAKAVVSTHGAYDPADLGALMARVDWVVVPSIWWENSPLVIQEAYAHGRPVIAADIGGMREKVREGQGGLLFASRDARALAERMTSAMKDTTLFDDAVASLPAPPGIDPWVDAHLATVYGAHEGNRPRPD
jgi:glycosyltransferase involved in cell wall biosynthesis